MTGTPRSSSIVHIVTPESTGSIFTDLATTSTGHRSWKEREKERDGKEEQGASDPSGLGNGRQMSWLPSPLSTPPPLHSSVDLTMLTSSPPPQRSDSSSWPPANPPPAFSSSYRPPPTPTLQHSKALQLEDLLRSFFRPEICSLQCDECHSGEEGMAEVSCPVLVTGDHCCCLLMLAVDSCSCDCGSLVVAVVVVVVIVVLVVGDSSGCGYQLNCRRFFSHPLPIDTVPRLLRSYTVYPMC